MLSRKAEVREKGNETRKKAKTQWGHCQAGHSFSRKHT